MMWIPSAPVRVSRMARLGPPAPVDKREWPSPDSDGLRSMILSSAIPERTVHQMDLDELTTESCRAPPVPRAARLFVVSGPGGVAIGPPGLRSGRLGR